MLGMNMMNMFSQLFDNQGPVMIRYNFHRPIYRIILFGD